ncbi:hypothetical protein VDGL01_02633 [Verticillium dahliae]
MKSISDLEISKVRSLQGSLRSSTPQTARDDANLASPLTPREVLRVQIMAASPQRFARGAPVESQPPFCRPRCSTNLKQQMATLAVVFSNRVRFDNVAIGWSRDDTALVGKIRDMLAQKQRPIVVRWLRAASCPRPSLEAFRSYTLTAIFSAYNPVARHASAARCMHGGVVEGEKPAILSAAHAQLCEKTTLSKGQGWIQGGTLSAILIKYSRRSEWKRKMLRPMSWIPRSAYACYPELSRDQKFQICSELLDNRRSPVRWAKEVTILA